ncbi:MAG: lipopolysaccharide biosynthesis protein [Armatimonadota bacterium]
MASDSVSQQSGRVSCGSSVASDLGLVDTDYRVLADDKGELRASLRLNISWTVLGNVVYAGCQWAMLMVMAKLGSPELVGRFSLGLAITAPVITLASCQLRIIQATDAKQDYCFPDYLIARLICLVPALGLIVLICAVSGYRLSVTSVVMAIGFAKAFESVSDIYYGLIQQHERMDIIAKSKIIKGILSLVAIGGGIYLTGDVFWAAVCLAVTWSVILFGYDVRNGIRMLRLYPQRKCRRATLKQYWHVVRSLIWLAAPLGVSGLLSSLHSNIPRYYVAGHLGEASLGVFSATAYVMMPVLTVVYAIGESALPRLGRYYTTTNLKAFLKLLAKLVGLTACVGIVGIIASVVWGERILSILFAPEYAKASNVFVLVMVASTITGIAALMNYAMTATRQISPQLPILLTICGVTGAVCAFAVPVNGLVGAAEGLIAGAIVHMLLGCMVVSGVLYRLAKS